MKLTPLARGAKQLKRSGFKTTANGHKMRLVTSKPKKAPLPSLKKLRDRNDKLLTPLAQKYSPKCEACGHPTQVGHHWIEKSRSAYLRYDMRNIIALCHSCHAKIHNRFGNNVVGGLDVAEIIIMKRGREWKDGLDIDQPKYVKVDRLYYETWYDILKRLSGA